MELHFVTKLQNSLSQASQYLERIQNIGESDDGEDLYYLIDFFSYLVDQTYPAIPCRTGCSHCCVESGLPRTSALEWQHIHRYLQDEMGEETLQLVLNENEKLHRQQLPAFLVEQRRIENPDSKIPLEGFGCTRCPLLVEGKCSIYPVRPAICRGFGFFTWRLDIDRDAQILACQMAADALLKSLQEAGIPYVALPRWNGISDKVYALNEALSTGVMATLPLWLFAHSEITPESPAEAPVYRLKPLNLSPNFTSLPSQP